MTEEQRKALNRHTLLERYVLAIASGAPTTSNADYKADEILTLADALLTRMEQREAKIKGKS
jgi:hypothetical protein